MLRNTCLVALLFFFAPSCGYNPKPKTDQGASGGVDAAAATDAADGRSVTEVSTGGFGGQSDTRSLASTGGTSTNTAGTIAGGGGAGGTTPGTPSVSTGVGGKTGATATGGIATTSGGASGGVTNMDTSLAGVVAGAPGGAVSTGTTQASYTLTVALAGTGAGEVISKPAGLSCGTTCSAPFANGSQVSLTQKPSAGSTFAGWSGDCSGLGDCTLTMNQAHSVKAAFAPVATFSVSGSIVGGSGVTVAATSTTPQATCAAASCRVPEGGVVTLTAPAEAPGFLFTGWSGGAGCSSTSNTITLSSITADTACTATYTPVYTVTVTVVGGPAGTTITPNSTTPKATCSAGSCKVPSGGSATATAPSLTNWYFTGWTGALTSSTADATLSGIIANMAITANYINQRQEPCADQPPANAVTSSTPQVTTAYTTVGGWSSPTQCPWTCKPDYCLSANACIEQYVDVLSYTGGTSSFAYGYVTALGFTGIGQGVSSTSKITMDRFGFNLRTGFSSGSGQPITQANRMELDQRDANGQVLASFAKSLDPSFSGGWVFWDTPSTTLNANALYIFTSFLATAETQKVETSVAGDTTVASTAGGSYYWSIQENGTPDFTSWSAWVPGSVVLQFRIQKRNSACQ
jgi:hypothetical protein